MRLKKIEISGFKSFLDRTKLVFQPGITAIVGPNGCGKSNVVDAVLWVMGEQSAKSLRGGAMEDVIFSGTMDREQVGMAEVSLMLDNSSGTAPAQYSSFAEIQVTRRLYRTGESEYMINKAPCRLRDILELFMDTGVGAKAYSIIKQGQIDRITSAKPEELRGFIEEAAGIAKYKARKKAAERKMQATGENLVRLEDILREIERQLDSLNRQARKAEKYKSCKEELTGHDLALAQHRLAELKTELEQRETRLRQAKDRDGSLANEIEAREGRIEAGRAGLLELEKEINDLSRKHFAAHSNAQEAESRMEIISRQIQNVYDLRSRAESEIMSVTEQIDKIEGELLEMEGSRRAITLEVASSDADLQVRARELAETRERMETIRHGHEDAMSQHAALEASIAAIRQTLIERREQLNDFENRLNEKKIAKTLLIEESEQIKQLSFDFTKSLDDLIKAKSDLQIQLSRETGRLESLKYHFDEKELLLDNLKSEFNKRLSRFDSLRELESNLEGYQAGVRSIMLEKENREGIIGLVADVMTTSPRYEKALEAVLGDRVQNIIVRSHEEGVEAIDYLKTQATGRGTFIPIEISPREQAPLPEVYADRIVGNLIDLVEVQPEYARIVQYLIGDVVVASDIKTAIEIWRSNGHQKTLVTLDGEVVDPLGVLSGGASIGVGIIKKRREIRELEKEVELLRGQVEFVSEECATLESKISETEKNIEEAKNVCHKRDMEILHHEKEIEKYHNNSERIRRSLKELSEEEESLVREAERCARRIQELNESLTGKQARLTDLLDVIMKGSETLKVFEEEISSREETLTNLKIDYATSREKLDATEHRIVDASSRRDYSIENRRKKMAEIAHGAETVRKLETDIEDHRAVLSQAHGTRMELEENLNGMRDSHQRLFAGQSQQEESLKEMRRELESIRLSLNELYVSCNECSMKIEHLTADIDDKYAVDILERGAKLIEGEAQVAEMMERRNHLRERIDRMGEVNLTAIKEYEDLKQRFDFLSGQKEDLVKSIDDLQSVIKKINKTSRTRFAETFQAVNENFKKLCPKIFGGGKASLILEETQDILEAGIEIEAQPPGKKLQKMTLLSGGEKALTAVALIFSLFLVKPSPFCIMDEVDSPLDDVNIDRFNDIVRDLSRTSQFIVITHNKRTMELADILYGVTMEQRGISKLVSVRLSDMDGKEAA